ncbi:MAG: ATP--guanido phosphotransferase [Clostridia bacterium]|nr:ATP--guanido phosphotransferase [Clostridia bacterium]
MIWFENDGRDKDVVVSTRVRLARNLEDYPFVSRLDEPSRREIIGRLAAVYDGKNGYRQIDFAALPEQERRSYSERHLVSREFAEDTCPRSLFVSENDGVYVMTPEEDHVRIQCVMSGLELDEAYRRAAAADDLLDAGTRIAYSEKYGYLTHCPTNLGTGMRASVMLFLPALTRAGQMRSLQNQLSKIGLTVRGMGGEGTAADGCLYQISNQITLGVSEEETLKKLADVTAQIVKSERELRGKVTDDEKLARRDRCRRALGTLLYAEVLSSRELLALYADVRLGAAVGDVDTKAWAIDRMLFTSLPATLVTMAEKKPVSALERDKCRAENVRLALAAE